MNGVLVIGMAWLVCGIIAIYTYHKQSYDYKKPIVYKRKLLLMLIIFFFIFGIITILGYLTGESLLINAGTFLAVGLLCLGIGLRDIYLAMKCTQKIIAEYVGYYYQSIRGTSLYTPKFEYEYKGEKYTSLVNTTYSKRKINKYYKEGNKYDIYIDSDNPEDCTDDRRIKISTIALILFAMVCISIFIAER
ncbi:DUF3592 domain-containing protein [Erysipelotrichaceae bacterium OttesenSCG-928-M19]|nr:DUF3592 domain-containing protein [Erysipelotrichaceae bacterium OttesenSCG-928-M19]